MSLLFLILGDALELTVDHCREHRDEPDFAPDYSGPVRQVRRRREAVLGIFHRQYQQPEHAHGLPSGVSVRRLVRGQGSGTGPGRAVAYGRTMSVTQ